MEPAPSILAYANPRGGQPAGSRFVVEHLPNGVALRRSTQGDVMEAIAVGLVVAMVVAVAFLCIWGAVKGPYHDWSNALLAMFAVALLVAGKRLAAYAVFVAWPREQAIVVDGGVLTVMNGASDLGRRRRWTARPRAFKVSNSGVNLSRQTRHCNVVIAWRSWSLGLERPILSNLPRDECVWIAGMLNAALSTARPHANGGNG